VIWIRVREAGRCRLQFPTFPTVCEVRKKLSEDEHSDLCVFALSLLRRTPRFFVSRSIRDFHLSHDNTIQVAKVVIKTNPYIPTCPPCQRGKVSSPRLRKTQLSNDGPKGASCSCCRVRYAGKTGNGSSVAEGGESLRGKKKRTKGKHVAGARRRYPGFCCSWRTESKSQTSARISLPCRSH